MPIDSPPAIILPAPKPAPPKVRCIEVDALASDAGRPSKVICKPVDANGNSAKPK